MTKKLIDDVGACNYEECKFNNFKKEKFEKEMKTTFFFYSKFKMINWIDHFPLTLDLLFKKIYQGRYFLTNNCSSF